LWGCGRAAEFAIVGERRLGAAIIPTFSALSGFGKLLMEAKMTTAATALQGSGRIVDDFSTFCEGDVEPTLNKTIHSIIDGGKDYIVYVDHDMSVEWSMSGSYGPSPTGFSEVANAVGHLETQAIGRLKPSQLEPFSRLCAEAIARVIGDHDLSAAREAVAGAEAFLEARSTENAKSWEVVAAMESAGVAIAGLVCFLLFRVQLTAVVGRDALDLSAGFFLALSERSCPF